MITQISYNVLIERFRAFASGHYLIEAFTHGELSQTDLEKEQTFPWMHVFPVEVEPRQGMRLYTFIVTFADLPRDKETDAEYQRESLSDCIKLAEDLLAEIQNGLVLFGPTVELEGSATIEPFIKEFTHTLTGVNLTLTISVPWDWSACDIPADWTVGGAGSGGSGTPIGLLLQTNGVDNGSQSLLNLQAGTNVTITDNGSGTITISASGGGGGGGTVTSVGLNAPAAFTVSGSPVTNSGTLTLSGAGTSGDYIDGTGALQPFPSIPTAQGLQDVITTDPVLTTDNTIDCNTFGLTISDTSNFTVNSTSKLNLDVNGTASFSIDKNSVTSQKVTGTVQTQVLVDTQKAVIAANDSSSANETSLTLFPNSARLKTPNVNDSLATVGQVLTLSNAATGEVEFTTVGTGTVTSVGLSMPSAFTVAGSPVSTAGTLAVTGAGNTGQYIRGDGTLANFPATGGGGGQVFYFNGNISQGTIGGNQFYELGTEANTGPAANFTRATTGVIARFITDVNSPNHLIIPAGVWTVDVYLSETGGGSNNAEIIAVLKIYNGATFTTIASSPLEQITNGNVPDLYTFAISVPNTVTAATDRVVIEFDIQNTNGKTVTLYTEDSKIGEVHSTYAIGLSSLNGLTANTQNFATGTAGTNFAISSAGSIHTFNLPTASAVNRGALSSADWITFNNKQNTIGLTTVGNNLATLPNPSDVRYLRINADNSVSALTLAQLKTDLSVGTDISVVLGSNITNVGTGFEDVTGLSFAVSANKTYKWRATLSYAVISSAAITFSTNGPTTSINNARFTTTFNVTTNAVSNQATYDAGTNAAVSANGLSTADGIFRTTAAGTWTIRFRASAGATLTVRAGSIVEYSEVL